MRYQKWNTKEDIIKDLAFASGKPLKDEDVVVVGDRPSKKYDDCDGDIEEQMQYLLSGNNSTDSNMAVGPDLDGITEMILMLDDSFLCDKTDSVNVENTTNEVIILSKLNPNVPEFIPKNINQDIKEEKSKGNNTITEKVIKNEKTENCLKDDLNETTIMTLDISRLTNNDTDQLRDRLRNTISETLESNCQKVKRQRNLAMSSLMKLCAKDTKDHKNTEIPLLMTPSHFELRTDKSLKLTFDPDKESSSIANNLVQQLRPTEKSCDIDKAGNNHESDEVNQLEVRKSTEKVYNWISSSNETSSSNSPIFMTGPITFKKKLKKPTPTEIRPVVKDPVVEFKPSEYAYELLKKYSNNLKVKDISDSMLHLDLKAKN
ncbi:unnamed protein product [Leptidea sinapis]|uniref:Uncharacterized protein n=1 Tax=Leptidea sinapis TaxID=189913 RepID=A0A5E4PMV0_9NEOP|nr:unnamed protein product [Leptidea sinapis]